MGAKTATAAPRWCLSRAHPHCPQHPLHRRLPRRHPRRHPAHPGLAWCTTCSIALVQRVPHSIITLTLMPKPSSTRSSSTLSSMALFTVIAQRFPRASRMGRSTSRWWLLGCMGCQRRLRATLSLLWRGVCNFIVATASQAHRERALHYIVVASEVDYPRLFPPVAHQLDGLFPSRPCLDAFCRSGLTWERAFKILRYTTFHVISSCWATSTPSIAFPFAWGAR